MMKLNAPRRTTAAAASGTRFCTQKRHNQQKIKRFALSLHTKKQQALEAFFCGRALAVSHTRTRFPPPFFCLLQFSFSRAFPRITNFHSGSAATRSYPFIEINKFNLLRNFAVPYVCHKHHSVYYTAK